MGEKLRVTSVSTMAGYADTATTQHRCRSFCHLLKRAFFSYSSRVVLLELMMTMSPKLLLATMHLALACPHYR